MSSTVFQDYNQNNPIVASWLNDVNTAVYTVAGTPKKAVQSSTAWVRFSIAGGVVTIEQSFGVSTVTRVGVGLYQINYSAPLTNTANCYSMSCNQPAFGVVGAESNNYVQVYFVNPANTTNFDPGFVSVVVFGAD